MRLAEKNPEIVMKQPTFNPATDQNWTWPEKTWFRERLNAVKAREQELRRKPILSPHKVTAVDAKAGANEGSEQI